MSVPFFPFRRNKHIFERQLLGGHSESLDFRFLAGCNRMSDDLLVPEAGSGRIDKRPFRLV
jgi:hypothetical protein